MNYIYYQTKTLFSNTGDVLINRSLITTLRTYGIIRANCASNIPSSFIEALGVRKEEKIEANSEWAFLLHIFKTAVTGNRVYIISGLGHISGGGVKRIVRNIAACLVFMIYRLLRVNIVRIGFSIGNITKGLAFTELKSNGFRLKQSEWSNWSGFWGHLKGTLMGFGRYNGKCYPRSSVWYWVIPVLNFLTESEKSKMIWN